MGCAVACVSGGRHRQRLNTVPHATVTTHSEGRPAMERAFSHGPSGKRGPPGHLGGPRCAQRQGTGGAPRGGDVSSDARLACRTKWQAPDAHLQVNEHPHQVIVQLVCGDTELEALVKRKRPWRFEAVHREEAEAQMETPAICT